MRLWQVGLIGAMAGLAAGLVVWQQATGDGYEIMPPAAALGGAFSAMLMWRVFVSGRIQGRIWRGALAGGLASIFGHFLTIYLAILYQNLCFTLWGGCTSSLGEPPAGPLLGLAGALAMSAFSLLFFGWLTVPLGVLLGALLGRKGGQ